MFIGDTYYITEAFNDKKYHVLFEEELQNVQSRSTKKLSSAFIEASISAMLECKDANSMPQTVIQMEKLLYVLGVKYQDKRISKSVKASDFAVQAVKGFIILYTKTFSKDDEAR